MTENKIQLQTGDAESSDYDFIIHRQTCDRIFGNTILFYCDLRGWIKGTARALYPVNVERALWPILNGQYWP